MYLGKRMNVINTAGEFSVMLTKPTIWPILQYAPCSVASRTTFNMYDFINFISLDWGLLRFTMFFSVYKATNHKVQPQYFSKAKVWILVGPVNHLGSFLFSSILFALLLCLWLLSWPNLDQALAVRQGPCIWLYRILWYSEEFMVTKWLQGAQTISPAPLCLTNGVFDDMLCLVSYKYVFVDLDQTKVTFVQRTSF